MLRRRNVKKTSVDVDNPSEYNEKSVQLYQDIHNYLDAGYSIRETAKLLHHSRNTIKKYAYGNYDDLCKKSFRSKLDKYYNYILESLKAKKTRSAIYHSLVEEKGYKGTKTTAINYMNQLIDKFQIDVALYRSESEDTVEKRKKLEEYNHVSRASIFRFLWMNQPLDSCHKSYILEKYPLVHELYQCILEFRYIFQNKNMPELYLFIERYRQSESKFLVTFANGLNHDIAAVENAVASPLSNGFVEGTNSRLKMIKRTMYGRANKELLEAKLIGTRGV